MFFMTLLNEFSIIALTETWLNKDIYLLVGIDKNNEFAQHTNDNGGGIKVYIRDYINVNVLNELCNTQKLYEFFVCEVFFAGVKYIF